MQISRVNREKDYLFASDSNLCVAKYIESNVHSEESTHDTVNKLSKKSFSLFYTFVQIIMEILLYLIGWLLSIATALGNGLVIFLVAKHRRLHSAPANKFVLSLAVADFGVGIAVFPSSYFCSNYSLACNAKVYMTLFWFFLHSSVTNLCTLTLDRYIAIVHPLKYNISRTVRRPAMVILIAWLIPFAISLSLLVGVYATTSDTALRVIRLTGVSAFDVVCCALLFYAVVRILVVARAQSHKETEETAIELQVQFTHSSTDNANPLRGRHKKHNTAPFIIAIVAFFLGCYVVVNYLLLCMTFSCHNFSDKAGLILILFLVLNSAVNPLVYAFLKKDIKKEINKLICRRHDNGKRRNTFSS